MGPVASYMVVDHHSGKIFAQKEANRKLPVASLTKVATGCVVLDWASATQTQLTQRLSVPPHAVRLGGANPLKLQVGDQLALRDAIYSALMASDNVAAEALAYHVGIDLLRRRGKQGDPTLEFVREMNALAGKLGMRQTKFVNAHGLDHGLRKPPYSTAADMARLARYAMGRDGFSFYVAQKERTISITRQGKAQKFKIKNTNSLVKKHGIDGVKTGQTTAAGPCVILSAKKSALTTKLPNGQTQVQPRRLTVVVLNAADRFSTGKQLLDWGWREHEGWNAAGRPMQDANGAL